MVKLGKNHPYVTSVPKQNRCATCNSKSGGYQIIHVYGTITSDLTIVDGQELIIDTLVIIDAGVTLLIQNGARITITNTGSLYNNGTFILETSAIFINSGSFINGTSQQSQQPLQNLFAQPVDTLSKQFMMTTNFSDTSYITNNDMQVYIDENNKVPALEKFKFNKMFQYIGNIFDTKPYFYKAIAENPVNYFYNYGTIINNNGAYIINKLSGIIVNNLLITNNGSICNENGIINNIGTFINNNIIFCNTGIFNNEGFLNNTNGTFNNTDGVINNTGTINNYGIGKIDGGIYNGTTPNGNQPIPPIPPPPSGGSLVGNITVPYTQIQPYPVYWGDGNINNVPTNLLQYENFKTVAMSISQNGIIVGYYTDASDNSQPILWNPIEGGGYDAPIKLYIPSDKIGGVPNIISYDGSTIIGIYSNNSVPAFPIYWKYADDDYKNNVYELLFNENTSISCGPSCCNLDASIIYGTNQTIGTNEIKPCYWTKNGDGSYSYITIITPTDPTKYFVPCSIVNPTLNTSDNKLIGSFVDYATNIVKIGLFIINTKTIIPISTNYISTFIYFGINTGNVFYGIGLNIIQSNIVFDLIQITVNDMEVIVTPISIPTYVTNNPPYNFMTIGYNPNIG